MKYEWNTGRQYAADGKGQPMVAQLDGQRLLFSDLARNINGAVRLGNALLGCALDRFHVQDLVMHNYDLGNFDYTNTTLQGESK